MELLGTSFFWVTLSQIIMINILLSGDNAVVIALASRSLPPAQQKKAVIFGSMGAIVLRVMLTFFAVALLTLPYLKILGGIALLWIAVKMLVHEYNDHGVDAHDGLATAIRIIVVADFVMSLDNVPGVAAAAKGNAVLLVIGLAISIPLIVCGSTLVLKLMERFGLIVTLGAGLVGWVAGEMLVSDPALEPWKAAPVAQAAHAAMPVVGALAVVAIGTWLAHNAHGATPAPINGLAPRVAGDSGPAVADRPPAPAANDETAPPGYHWVRRSWLTRHEGGRDYAALHGRDSFLVLVRDSSRLRRQR